MHEQKPWRSFTEPCVSLRTEWRPSTELKQGEHWTQNHFKRIIWLCVMCNLPSGALFPRVCAVKWVCVTYQTKPAALLEPRSPAQSRPASLLRSCTCWPAAGSPAAGATQTPNTVTSVKLTHRRTAHYTLHVPEQRS